VGQVFVEEGDMAAPQVPICTIVQMDRVEVQIQVPERDLGDIRPGMEAQIQVASVSDRTFRAPVSRISPVVDRLSRTATLRIMLDNPDHVVRPGSLADVRLAVERHENAVVVPQYALVLDERAGENGGATYRAYVIRSDGNTVAERRVHVGIFDGDDVEVLDGLNTGDRLVVQGQHLLRDRGRVRLVQPGGGADGGSASADGGTEASNATSGGGRE
jgi:RND family efflux transporter MFP subunit